METYNIIINSTSNIGGTDQSNYQYTFDWGLIPDGKYELKFKFSTTATGFILLLAIPDLGVSLNNYMTVNTATAGSFQNILGTINIESGNYKAVFSDNPTSYLSHRPMNNTFTVNITNIAGALTNIGAAYNLILNLKRLE